MRESDRVTERQRDREGDRQRVRQRVREGGGNDDAIRSANDEQSKAKAIYHYPVFGGEFCFSIVSRQLVSSGSEWFSTVNYLKY